MSTSTLVAIGSSVIGAQLGPGSCSGDSARDHTSAPDKKLRRLDCAVMNFYLRWLENHQDVSYDTARCGFVEGPAAFEGSGIRHESHVQVAVRNPACVVGVFRPT